MEFLGLILEISNFAITVINSGRKEKQIFVSVLPVDTLSILRNESGRGGRWQGRIEIPGSWSKKAILSSSGGYPHHPERYQWSGCHCI